MFLPQGNPGARTAAAWDDARFVDEFRQATVDAGGAALVSFGPVPQDERWLVDRVVVVTSSRAGAAWFGMYLDDVDDSRLIDGTNAGDFDVNDADSPLELEGGEQLVCVWSNATPGDVATCRIHYAAQRQDVGE